MSASEGHQLTVPFIECPTWLYALMHHEQPYGLRIIQTFPRVD